MGRIGGKGILRVDIVGLFPTRRLPAGGNLGLPLQPGIDPPVPGVGPVAELPPAVQQKEAGGLLLVRVEIRGPFTFPAIGEGDERGARGQAVA